MLCLTRYFKPNTHRPNKQDDIHFSKLSAITHYLGELTQKGGEKVGNSKQLGNWDGDFSLSKGNWNTPTLPLNPILIISELPDAAFPHPLRRRRRRRRPAPLCPGRPSPPPSGRPAAGPGMSGASSETSRLLQYLMSLLLRLSPL